MIDRYRRLVRAIGPRLFAAALCAGLCGPAGATVIAFTGTPDFMALSPGAKAVDGHSVLTGQLRFIDAYRGGVFNAADVARLDLQIGGLDFTTSLNEPAASQITGHTSDQGMHLDGLFYQLTLPLWNTHCAGCSLNLAVYGSPGRFVASYETARQGSGVLLGQVDNRSPSPPGGNTNIPEPPAWLLFGFGLALLGWGVRRRRSLPPRS
ncbi:PEP-CTERM sorting domain-containing protein [Salinisphaera hydrothermalis]|uniref:Ice-binding protein C-terminal domain-containing protein n=1 Tax=Salinisphaera hydrothermalis (strain C41B8) TaxID=1304275 RepID=A0A084IK98_SALHC|nr:PEP-CTERM sorting domain-containing protein [Salinisphaera hydrothermalis]KEZ77132.1 hypothetical protein C41B8_11103 [Salinisphaera hydrothermalis C41B8]